LFRSRTFITTNATPLVATSALSVAIVAGTLQRVAVRSLSSTAFAISTIDTDRSWLVRCRM
jgi:hypothetical protein